MAGAQHLAVEEDTSITSTSSHILTQLPVDILCRCVVQPFLSSQDKSSLRQSTRWGRRLVNAAACRWTLDASLPEHAAAAAKLPVDFPGLQHVGIVNKAAAASATAAEGTSIGCCAAPVRLQEQLPLLLQQLPCLNSLSFEGPQDRRQPGLDITAALAALAATAAAAATAAPPASVGSDVSVCCHQQQQREQQQQHQQQLQQQLTKLELRAGRLSDAVMAAVGRLSGMRCLQLTATTAIDTAPLSALTRLSHLQLTVTPPLWSALAPLSGLATLATLHMAAISPAKGWGSALQMLRGCALRELVLVFADVCDGDMAGLAGLTGLTHLDLHCSRHLTAACVPHIAQLQQLKVLHLQHTGCQLGPAELDVLGSSCRQLMELHAEFDLRALPEPPAGLFAGGIVKPEAQLTVVTAVRAVQQTAPSSGPRWGYGAQQALHLQDRHSHASSNLSNLGSGSSSSITHQHPFTADPAGFARGGDEGVNWPPLQHVEVCSGCSIGNLHKLLHHCKVLRHLQLDSMGPNGNGAVAALVNRAPQLTALQLSGCSSMSEHACSSIGGQLHVLQELHLHESAIPATHLMALLRGIAGRAHATTAGLRSCCPAEMMPLQQLTHLRIERCAGFTDEVVVGVVMQLSELRTLEVVGCEAVSGKALLSLVGRLVKLTRLLVAGCRGVGADFGWAWQRAAAEMCEASGSLGPDAGDGARGGGGACNLSMVQQQIPLPHQHVIWQP